MKRITNVLKHMLAGLITALAPEPLVRERPEGPARRRRSPTENRESA